MGRNEHRPESFGGIALGVPQISEIKDIQGERIPEKLLQVQNIAADSSVEAQICFRETVKELGDYMSTLSDAEIVAIQAQVVFDKLPTYESRVMERLGVEDKRLAEIREEMRNIVFG